MKRFFTLLKTFGKHEQAEQVTRITRKSFASSIVCKAVLSVALIFFFAGFSNSFGQLGVYEFTGQKECPTQNPFVTTQPANAVFSSFSTVNARCKDQQDNICNHDEWNDNSTIDLSEYHQFGVTANPGYILNLSSFSFSQYVKDEDNGNTIWALRSSLDNYASDIATGSALESTQTPIVNLPAAFSGITSLTFRIYLINSKNDGNEWTIDDVTLSGSADLFSGPADPGNPTSNSPQCSNPGVILTASGTAPAGETWYWQTSATGTNTSDSGPTYTVTSSGTYYIRAQNNSTLEWSLGAGSVVVTVTPDVATPVFVSGASSTRCQGASTVTYTANASSTTGISYSLDAGSIAGGNTINASTGAVTYAAGWTGTSVITASAAGCNGPTNATHTVTTNVAVGNPVFVLGASSFRCVGISTVTYTATATNATNITYSIDGTSAFWGCTINPSTGAVTFSLLFSGTSTITATATGCGGPTTATHTVTVNGNVGTPVFVPGASSARCQGAGTVTYNANAANNSGITYSLDATSTAAGNTINTSTGEVTYTAGWAGTATITASATGCNGPRSAIHTATTNAPVTNPVFTLGAGSTRCQAGGIVTYSATATNTTGITYTLDAASLAGSNTINASTGAVNFSTGWSGTSVITASAAGCDGPAISTHAVTVTPTVSTPVFSLGAGSVRCQGAATVTYSANSTNTTGITYSLDATSVAGGNTINASTGAVTFAAGWNGVSTITASAAGCNGPRTSSHTVTSTATVGAPVFVLGVTSTRSQIAGTISYTASATGTSGITYSLDASSLAAGNTINATTGDVTYTAAWTGTSVITATAAGCNGPSIATHTASTNPSWVIKQLYLTNPGQSLDRVDPVNTADATTANTALLSTAGTTFTTFTMAPALCDSLVIKAGTITIRNYLTISSGTMPASPAITAVLSYGANNIITLSNPTYNAGLLTWTGTLAADVTVPAGEAIEFRVTTAQAGVIFRIDFDSQTKPSRIDLPVSTFINITSLEVYSAAYPGGLSVTSGTGGTTKYIRATVTDPFGFADITGMNITITPGSTVSATSVASFGCERVYEYVWNTPAASGDYVIAAIAREGFENTVTSTKNTSFSICATCAPVAVNDSASGAGGNPIVANVLANDYDPNNNINTTSLGIAVQPKNGSAYISNNQIIYLPNGTFQGNDTLTYRICDLTSPTPLCATAQVFFTIDPLIVDICAAASETHTYYIPYPEALSFIALQESASINIPSNNIRTIISIKVPYTGMVVRWDDWEDGFEANILNPTQASTKVWGDGNPFNGVAPGYGSDLIPAGGSIVLDNTMNANPRNPSNIYFDGGDKVVSNGQLALTQVSAEPSIMSVQSIKTNVTSTYDFGQSFTIPLGENFNSQDFEYTALFIRAAEDNTTVNIDKDNNGTFETTTTLNEGQTYLVNGGVMIGATVASDKPVGVELNAGGVDNYSIRNAPIFPATWYSHTYYTPVPTSDNPGDNPKDSSAVMFYNSLNRTININWYSGAPASGVIAVPAKSAVRFPLAYSTTSTYKFVNLTGESFTAIEMVDSYTPGSGGNSGSSYDWSFNLISEARLTDYATVAWAPGGLDLNGNGQPDVNGNPIWVTPTINTTIYVKYDGNVNGTTGSVSPCGLRYDVAYNVNALNYIKIRDNSDNDQGGIAIYTCNGAKIAAAYGEDPLNSIAGVSAYWDVGSTIQPFCKQKLIIATDDNATTLVSQPVTISVLNNDFGFLAVIDPNTVTTLGLLQPQNGTVTVNDDGTILYTPNVGFVGVDTFEYNVCSTPSPVVCDIALVIVTISSCPSNGNQNIISGQVFIDRNKDGLNNDGAAGLPGVEVYLYTDGNCSGTPIANELTDSVTVDSSGFYQFVKYPEKTVEDNFDNGSGGGTCANGTDGDSPWASNWSDAGDGSSGFCQGSSTADVEIMRDGTFGYALRLKDNDVSARRTVNLNGATKAFLTFSYRRKSTSFSSSNNIRVQVSSNGGSSYFTIYTIRGNNSIDADYTTIYNQDISAFAASNTVIRFLTSSNMTDADTVYIDNVSVRYLRYPQCYIAAINMSSVPADYSLTTASQRSMTLVSGGTCSSQADFGFAKPNVTVSGTLRNDNNGLVDNQVNGAPVGAPGGNTVYAYLVDVSGEVALKTTVNSTTGAYSFPLAEINTTYTLRLSTNNVALGAASPVTMNCPSIWINVGDAYGINNQAGSGNKPGAPDGAIPVRTGTVNVNNVDVGIQRLPNSDNYITGINQPTINQMITLNGVGMNPPVLSGSDPEDCSGGSLLTNRAVIIDTVPTNTELYYNGSLVVNGQFINNFNPNMLQVKMTAAALGDTMTTFRYSFVDAAVMKDPSPATYTLIWYVPLPATGLTVKAGLNNSIATIQWQTISEHNTSHFVVERSVDNSRFTAVGNPVQAAGNSEDKRQYQLPDNITGLVHNGIVYYRIKLVDIDGETTYSNVVVVRPAQKIQVTTWPNPFKSSMVVSLNTEKETIFKLRLVDANGKLIRELTHSANKGMSQINLEGLGTLPAGFYLLQVTDQKSGGVTVQKLIKE